MSKVISEKVQESNPAEVIKQVEIKHTSTMKDASGNDVVVVDHVEVKNIDDAISQSEKDKARLEVQLAEVEAELADYIAIRDAE